MSFANGYRQQIAQQLRMILEEVKGREKSFVIDTIVTWADMIIVGMQFGGLEVLAAVAQTQKAEILEALTQILDTTTVEGFQAVAVLCQVVADELARAIDADPHAQAVLGQ